METTEFVAAHKSLMLDENNFGHWKVRMKQQLKGIEEDVWTAVETGWTDPTICTEDDEEIAKPKNKWTKAEKTASRLNAKALSEIFNAISSDQFKLVQGCCSAKDAWDTLVEYYEGTSTVKRARLDYLASQFENLRMADEESITSFSSKLSSIANEAIVLGKNFKDKKLVKKLIRCLPEKFASYKALFKVGMNTDEMKFSQLVGILKAEEMEAPTCPTKIGKETVFAAEKETDRFQSLHESLNKKLDECVELLTQNFKEALKQFEKEQRKNSNSREVCASKGCQTCDCHCHDVCKRQSEVERPCHQKRSDEKLSLVALIGKENDEELKVDSDSDSDGEIDVKAEYRKLYDSWVELSNENLNLLKNKALLEAQINIIEMEKPTALKLETPTCSTKDNGLTKQTEAGHENTCVLESKINRLSDLLSEEKEKSRNLEHNLNENNKKIRMLSKGTKDLDTLLAMGQPAKQNWGLGYIGNRVSSSSSGTDQACLTNFVRAKPVSDIKSKEIESHQTCSSKEVLVEQTNQKFKQGCYFCGKPGHIQRYCYALESKMKTRKAGECSLNYGCYSCGKLGHTHRFCYERINNIKKAWSESKCYVESKSYGKVWIAKSDLYSKCKETVQGLVCNVACSEKLGCPNVNRRWVNTKVFRGILRHVNEANALCQA